MFYFKVEPWEDCTSGQPYSSCVKYVNVEIVNFVWVLRPAGASHVHSRKSVDR